MGNKAPKGYCDILLVVSDTTLVRGQLAKKDKEFTSFCSEQQFFQIIRYIEVSERRKRQIEEPLARLLLVELTIFRASVETKSRKRGYYHHQRHGHLLS